MYAIIKTGGKQYKVSKGDIIEIEKLENNVGDKITFETLFIEDKTAVFGTPTIKGATVTATVLAHGKGEKVQTAIYKKMNGHHRAQGHRQPFTSIQIDAINK